MSRSIRRRPLARQDLIDIWRYIARDSEVEADKFLDRIDGVLHRLADRPLLGKARPELTEGLRSFPIGRYVAYYQVEEDGIDLIRIMSSYRDIDADTFETSKP